MTTLDHLDLWLDPEEALPTFQEGEYVEVRMKGGELTNLYAGHLVSLDADGEEINEGKSSRGYYNEDGEEVLLRDIDGVRKMNK